MIDISTTATFDRLFDKLPKTIKRKAATKTDLFQVSIQACSFSLLGWGLSDLPLRASNEGLLRPRVARAQKIIRPPIPFYPSSFISL